MLPIERKNEILSRLMIDGKVVVSDLSARFGVTEETIRRDLDRLDKEGLVSKTYGGAVAKQNPTLDLPYNVREGVNVRQKQVIAEKIVPLIRDGERILLDSSSTALYVVRKLKEKKNLTIITNSVKILIELADRSDWTVLSTGGVLKQNALSLGGSSAEKMIHSYHVDTAICSCKGLDMQLGIMDSNEQDSLIKQAMLDSAERRIVALDAEKFDKKSFVKVCGIRDIDLLVTDQAPSAEWRRFCFERGIDLLY